MFLQICHLILNRRQKQQVKLSLRFFINFSAETQQKLQKALIHFPKKPKGSLASVDSANQKNTHQDWLSTRHTKTLLQRNEDKHQVTVKIR
jgi:hypothetical protein